MSSAITPYILYKKADTPLGSFLLMCQFSTDDEDPPNVVRIKTVDLTNPGTHIEEAHKRLSQAEARQEYKERLLSGYHITYKDEQELVAHLSNM